MCKSPEEYLKEPYARILIPNEDGTYSAEILEFPGCFGQGDSADEAVKDLEKSALAWIQVSLDQGQEIPAPSLNQGYGGRIALRLPKSLHRRASELAERDGVSLNQFLLTAIAVRIGSEDLYNHLIQKLEKRFQIVANTYSAVLEINLFDSNKGSIEPEIKGLSEQLIYQGEHSGNIEYKDLEVN